MQNCLSQFTEKLQNKLLGVKGDSKMKAIIKSDSLFGRCGACDINSLIPARQTHSRLD